MIAPYVARRSTIAPGVGCWVRSILSRCRGLEDRPGCSSGSGSMSIDDRSSRPGGSGSIAIAPDRSRVLAPVLYLDGCSTLPGCSMSSVDVAPVLVAVAIVQGRNYWGVCG